MSIGTGSSGRLAFKAVRVIIAVAAVMPMIISHAALAAPAGKGAVVVKGESAEVRVTCRLKNGEVALTTDQAIAGDTSIPKSTIFLPRTAYTPFTLTAGVTPTGLEGVKEKGLEGEVLTRLSQAIVGLPVGEKQTLEMKAEAFPEQQKGAWLMKMARVRSRVKEMHFTPEEYESKTGNKPEVGRKFTFDPALPGRVDTVTDKEVIVRFSGENGKVVSTPLGKGTIVVKPHHYEIVIDAKPGNLIRTEALVGRVIFVDDRDITIDFGHPFGGETLGCDVLVQSAKPGTAEKAPAAKETSAKK